MHKVLLYISSSEKAVPWGELTREEKNLYVAIGTLIFIAAALAVAVAIYGLPKCKQFM